MLVLRAARVILTLFDPAVFFAQPAQPLDLPLDIFPFRPELSTAGLAALPHQPSGPTQWDEHAVQSWWEDFSSSFQPSLIRTPSTGPSAGDLFDDGFGDWSSSNSRPVSAAPSIVYSDPSGDSSQSVSIVGADPEELLSFGLRICYAHFIRGIPTLNLNL
ncbi:hypothetical protein B0H13DRAFT_1954955 [Mycena leptocephala]|nr:hypothetical protein B0H13DRAFT_1954955 [Mycena leptocephala]